MTNRRCAHLFSFVLLAAPVVWGQATASSIGKELKGLAAGSVLQAPGAASPAGAVSDAERPAAIVKIAGEIRTLPAGAAKVKLADTLFHAATQGEAGDDSLQAVADAFAQVLSETPQPPQKDGRPAQAYMDLARLIRYDGVSASFNDPMLAKAEDILAANDADVQKADFTLKDVDGKKYTLSGLKGKMVLVFFWATDCASCQKEMVDADLIYTHYQQQGLVVLTLSGENGFLVSKYLLATPGYHPPVLIDEGGKVAKQFHVDAPPRVFVFDRDGKLVAQSIDVSTQRQLFAMLGKAGLQPN